MKETRKSYIEALKKTEYSDLVPVNFSVVRKQNQRK